MSNQGATACCQGTDCGRCVGCIRLHRAYAVELASGLACWGNPNMPQSVGHIDLDLMAQAIADAEQRGYARGLADGAERERAAVVAYLRAGGYFAHEADIIESGEHLAGESE